MIVTVTANPALDLTWHTKRLTPGESHRVNSGVARAGGKGVNVARVAAAQGTPVLAITTAGGVTGRELISELETAEKMIPGLSTKILRVTAATRRSVTIVDETDATIFNEFGDPLSPTEWRELQQITIASLTADTSTLVISGSLPPSAPPEFIPRLVAAAKLAGKFVVVDTSGKALLAAADSGADVLKPNKAELASATGLADPVSGAQALVSRGARMVFCSLGSTGMLMLGDLADPEPITSGPTNPRKPQMLRARLAKPLVGNPTGAGDAAVAAIATLLDSGVKNRLNLLEKATSWSAAAVLMPSAGEISAKHHELANQLIIDSTPPATV